MEKINVVPRYSSRPLPRTAFLPGISRRAERPPRASVPPDPMDDDRLAQDDAFRHGLDLFNHGFPWEAHDIWEALWSAAPRDGDVRALLHGLIHAAAAAIKARTNALATARGFIESACRHLAGVHGTALDVASLTAALTDWASDVTRSPPLITLNAEHAAATDRAPAR